MKDENKCEHQCTSNCRRIGCNCECGDYHIEVCEMCGGTGEVSTMEKVYPGEPHMAPIGSAPCPECHAEPDDEYESED